MKTFASHTFSFDDCAVQLDTFDGLLRSKVELSERDDILPFFKKNTQLASFISTYVPDIANPDRIAIEYDIFGDFACDLAIGDSTSKSYLLVEFEDAKPNSLFITAGKKATPEWAPRLEHGLSQVLDWFWKLGDMEKSDDYENRFGARHVSFNGLVVVGRDQQLEAREKIRLKWRQDHTVVHSKKVSVVTFDQLARDLRYRLSRYSQIAQAKQA
ncbi:Shedu anti-phage system protein SduA domain-containing protein [Bradyrhizobium vignae]|uniref:Shedu protein SduA C-terminal domain-containing protein n=1 Tax=Bradyrhizobium vignae TaxID=1549949 RepID=A0A2U3PU19_9BRAD|nr:Shedu anti-phage system protein SduA domain-containing protein [Bradyrhizobium vignae]SPP92647.1 conserved protein of unknown function [Bradyrhizobium vignae]